MEPNEQIAAIKANSTAWRATSVRGVQGGFVVSGQTQYQDKDTKGVAYTENAEGVAADAQGACAMTLNYLNTGTFDAAPSPQANLFTANTSGSVI